MGAVNINGINLELDLLDADVMEKYEQLNKELVDQVQKQDYTNMSTAEGMRYQCRTVDGFFDNLFGAGTAAKIFKGKENNLGIHMEAYARVCDLSNKANGEIYAIADKYTPNRAQRRQNKGNHNYAGRKGQ